MPAHFLESVEKILRLEANRLITKMNEEFEAIQELRNTFDLNIIVDKNLQGSMQSMLSKAVCIGTSGSGNIFSDTISNSNIKNLLQRESPRHTQSNAYFDNESRYTGTARDRDQDLM